jgi:ubiquinone/menaquinone biosynthesis C-methylase UbiE
LVSILAAWLLLAGSAPLRSQVAEKANAGYRTKQDRARIALNLDSSDRAEHQKPRELLASLGIRPGETVADIGSGVGFMLPYLVEAVGPGGTIFAEEIQTDFLAKIEKKISTEGWQNVKTVLGADRDVMLPKKSLDWAFILDVYHHFEHPHETMASVRRALKAGGKLAVIDFYRSREHPRMSAERLREHIRLDRDEFASEIESAGFRLVRKFDHLPHQYVLVFDKE